jgi:hypothetical protein
MMVMTMMVENQKRGNIQGSKKQEDAPKIGEMRGRESSASVVLEFCVSRV